MSRGKGLFRQLEASHLRTVDHTILNETSLFRSEKARIDEVNSQAEKSHAPSLRTAAVGFAASISLFYAVTFFLITIV
jgi:hypothetical protein